VSFANGCKQLFLAWALPSSDLEAHDLDNTLDYTFKHRCWCLGAFWIWRVTGGAVIVVKNVENVSHRTTNLIETPTLASGGKPLHFRRSLAP
jgi:hypothetical protein